MSSANAVSLKQSRSLLFGEGFKVETFENIVGTENTSNQKFFSFYYLFQNIFKLFSYMNFWTAKLIPSIQMVFNFVV